MDDLGNFVTGAIKEVDEVKALVPADLPELIERLSNLRDNLSHIEGTLLDEGRI